MAGPSSDVDSKLNRLSRSVDDLSDKIGVDQKLGTLSTNVDKLTEKLDRFIDQEEQRRSAYSIGGGGDTLTRTEVSRYHIPPPDFEVEKKKKKKEASDPDYDDGKTHFGEDENKERGNWTGKLDFLLSCLGYAVGLGNVWRFPYLCYKNGGGAFLIPYAIMLLFVGLPIFFLELSLGQFTSMGPLTCWKFAPLFTGIGIGMVVVSSLVSIYYNMIIAWAFYYLFSSFTSVLPWAACDGWWNTKYCSLLIPLNECTDTTKYIMNETAGTCNFLNGTLFGVWDAKLAEKVAGIKRSPPTEEFWENLVLQQNEGLEYGLGGVRWQLCLCYLLAWIICFLCLSKGIKSSGRVVYFTALFPYVVLIILFVYGLTLEGHLEGIKFYIIPDFEKLKSASIWYDAAVQIFFSLSACWGGLIALSSYNRFHNNVLRDSLIVAFGNCLTSFFAGFVIFSFLGYLSHVTGVPVSDVVSSGPGLAFIVYPDAVTRLPISPLWAILFFLMLITLGLDSQFGLLECVITAIMDRFPKVRAKKTWFILALCSVFFLLGLTLTTQGGIYMLTIMDSYAGGWSVLFIGLCETTGLMYAYGWDRFSKDIQIMIGIKTFIWWRICWQFISPLLILVVMVFSWTQYKATTYGDYNFPPWADAMGWGMSLLVVLPIIGYAIYAIVSEQGTFVERFRAATSPTDEWGPYLVKHRRLVTYARGFVVDPNAPAVTNGFNSYSLPNMGAMQENGKEPEAHDNPAYDFERTSNNPVYSGYEGTAKTKL